MASGMGGRTVARPADRDGVDVVLGHRGLHLAAHALGPDYTEALDRHRRLLRSAWAASAGTEMGTEGDSFFVVFPTADGAVRAAVLAQRGLESQAWPGGERIRVRIGIHTGTPQLHEGDYVGMDVHRAARVAAAAHGGQVVLTSATAELAGGLLPEDVWLKDLGTHHLKDSAGTGASVPARHRGSPGGLPALRSLGASSSLPIPTTPLVGVNRAVSELSSLIHSPDVRLVTLTGPGGSGKTRLAIEVASRIAATFPDGVFFVPLASVASADVMWTSIADVLALPAEGSIAAGPARTGGSPSCALRVGQRRAAPRRRRRRHPAPRGLHGAPPSSRPPVVRWRCPASTCTGPAMAAAGGIDSVERRGVTGGRALRSAGSQRGADFRLTADNVAEVVAICQHLDGLPLAIELSAARIRLLSPPALLRRIDQTLDVAARSTQAPSRQRTLRDTIAWSYHLLSAHHQAFFRRLGVFAGGADLDAVAAVSEGVSLARSPPTPWTSWPSWSMPASS